MSYCVNCGVELAATEPNCPLCGVEVVNPKEPDRKVEKGLYPPSELVPLRFGFREFLAPLALILLVPLLICVISDLLTTSTLTWSVYVIGSMMLMYVYVFLPFVFRQHRMLICILFDWAITILFLFMIEVQSGGNWFMPIALPLSLAAGALLTIIVIVFERARLRKLVRFAIVIFGIGLYSVIINIVVEYSIYAALRINWSLYSLIACATLGILALFINRNSKLKAEAKRRFFI